MKKYFLIVTACLGLTLGVVAQSAFEVKKDVMWATVEGFELTMDIYTPATGKSSYPVLVIFHGGGWLINNKSIMNDMAAYVAERGYVVCNVNYRLLVDQNNTVTMDEIIGDVLGSVVWIKENIGRYKGDPKRVAVTGDSAGGHLASSVILMGNQLNENGFADGPKGFLPSYLPTGKTVADLINEGTLEVQAGLISYGAFDIYASCLGGFEQPSNFFWQMGGAPARPIFGEGISVQTHPDYYKAVSPSYQIPQATGRKLPPQFFSVGSKDNLTTPESVKAYVDKLAAAGQEVTYWVHEGRPHAFLDSGSNDFLGISFTKDAPEALDRMLAFLDGVF